MINDENRRAVAAIIRDMFKYECKYKVEFFDLLRDALDQEFDIVLGFDNMAEILADLIDRPTCHNANVDDYVFRCSECGAAFKPIGANVDADGEVFYNPFNPLYCSVCGAEVVDK